MGTMLQKSGLRLGVLPETLSITHPQLITDVHKQYVDAGSNVIYANTFGANALKLAKTDFSMEQVVNASIRCAKQACKGTNALVALDIGPIGELLQPNGTLEFERAVEIFKQIIECGKDADIVVFETFTDLYELKAGILACKETCDKPIMCSMSFEQNGRTFTGTPIESFCQTAIALGADAVGINCGLGPKQILPLAKKLCDFTPKNFPVFVKPNAGLPRADGSGYDLSPSEFACIMQEFYALGVRMVGGCCGTTPEYIKLTADFYKTKTPCEKAGFDGTIVCSATKSVIIDRITVCGERINPTGKKRFQQALKDGDGDYVLTQAIEQANAGAQILDVNVGIPDIDETDVLPTTVKNVQSVIDLPLMLDSSNAIALEKALRIYNGRPIVNSVNGEISSLDSILPLCKKYGACVVGLTLDKNGIPKTAVKRVEIAQKIVEKATQIGINKTDIFIDALTMTISAEQDNAQITLSALKTIKQTLGVKTVLGVSNISFGLPLRTNVNTTFLTLAMNAGLDLAIINPNSEEMMSQVFSFLALMGLDENCLNYIARYKNATQGTATQITTQSVAVKTDLTLVDAVCLGLKNKAQELTKQLIQTKQPLEIVDGYLIPALDKVGTDFEKGIAFLPELLCAAQSAEACFEVIKERLAKSGNQAVSKGTVVLATVKGDIHDIGKNIVKVVLQNYGYTVIDCGRDVCTEQILQAIEKSGAKLVGLSALMTTTVKSMEETIACIKSTYPNCKIMVGGAVLTADYALKIGADFYAKDAKKSSDICKEIFG